MSRLIPKDPSPEIILPDSIEGIILETDFRYNDLKRQAEEENLLRDARWWSIGEDEYQTRLEYLLQTAESREHEGVLPSSDFYKQTLAPAISEFVEGDSAEFARVNDLCFRAMKTINDVPVPQAATKRFIIERFFQQYFGFLHEESDEVVLGIAAMQGHRANLHVEKETGRDSPMQDYPFTDREVKRFIDLFSSSEKMTPFLPDFAAICAGINNGHVVERYMRNIPEILQALEEEPEHITHKYLTLAKAKGFPEDYSVFDFSNVDSIGVVKKLEEAGNYAEPVFKLFKVMLEQDMGGCKHDRTISSLLDAVSHLSSSPLADELPVILNEAIALAQHKLPGDRYVQKVEQIHQNAVGREAFLRHALDLTSIDKRCGRSYVYMYGKEFGLPLELRDRYHDVGLKLAAEFGNDASWFFDVGYQMLEDHPKQFETWLTSILNFGAERPHLLRKAGENSPIAFRMNSFGQMLETLAAFDDIVQNYLRKFSKRVLGVKKDEDFFHSFYLAKEWGVDPWKHLWNAAGMLSYGMSVNKDLPLDCARRGVDYDKAVALTPVFRRMGYFTSMKPYDAIIESDLNIFEKERLIEWSRVMERDHNDKSVLSVEGEWIESLRNEAVTVTTEAFEADTSSLDDTSLLLLYRYIGDNMTSFNSRDPRFAHLIETLGTDDAPVKNLPMGQSYGYIQHAGSRFDGLELRMQQGEIKDMGETDRLNSLTFFPHPNTNGAILSYMIHQDVGLLQFLPTAGEKMGEPIGVAVCVLTYDEGGDHHLLVDAIHTGSYLSEFPFEAWGPMLHKGLLHLANDMHAHNLIYNPKFTPGVGDPMERFVGMLESYGGIRGNIELSVARNPRLELIAEPLAQACAEIQEEMKEARRRGDYVSMSTEERFTAMNRQLSRMIGLQLKSWRGTDRMDVLYGNAQGATRGVAEGHIFPLSNSTPTLKPSYQALNSDLS